MAIKGVKLNKKGEAVIYLDVYAQTDELKDAVNELPEKRPGFKSHSQGLEIKEDITIPAGKYDIVMWKGFTKAGNPKMTINIGDHNPKYAQPSNDPAPNNNVSQPPVRDAGEDWLNDI
tara:strand:+ start:3649 stop:4002 length:354 start_codon:yes stop_codon:yes gene_type:complete